MKGVILEAGHDDVCQGNEENLFRRGTKPDNSTQEGGDNDMYCLQGYYDITS